MGRLQVKSFSIYYLIDPTDQQVRYVGYSREPEKRYITHILQSAYCRTHKECWITSLLQQDLHPTLSVKCIIGEASEAKRVEVALIAMFRSRGVDLVNGTRGGDGSAGFKWSAENYRKHKDHWETVGRHKPSLLKGRSQTKQHIQATLAANTPELLASRGAAIKAGWARRRGVPTIKKGRPTTHRSNRGQRWKLTDEQRQRMRNGWTPERRAAQAERMLRRQLEREEKKLAKLKLEMTDAK